MYILIVALSIVQVATSSSATTSNFTDNASISSDLTTAYIDAGYSGQDSEVYYWMPSDRLDYVNIETRSDQLWYPGRKSVIEEIEISNNGNMDFLYTLNRSNEYFDFLDLDESIHAQVFIDDNLAYDGELNSLTTEKYRLDINQSATIKFVFSMISNENDDKYSDRAMVTKINVDTFFMNDSAQFASKVPSIVINGIAERWRENIHREQDITNNSVWLMIKKTQDIHNSVIEYSTDKNFSDSIRIPVSHAEKVDFYDVRLGDLNPGTTYYVRTRIENPEFGSGISDVFTFTTLP